MKKRTLIILTVLVLETMCVACSRLYVNKNEAIGNANNTVVDDMKDTINDGQVDNTQNKEVALEGNEYNISKLPGMIKVGSDYNVYSLDNEFTEKMCQDQGTDMDSMQTYLSLCGYDMIIVPSKDLLRSPSFEIDIRVKEKDYGIENLKDLDDVMFKMGADTLVAGFYASDGSMAEYTVYENDKAKYIVFDCVLTEEQRRYATIIEGKMIYFIGKANGQVFTQEQDAEIRKIVDSLSY